MMRPVKEVQDPLRNPLSALLRSESHVRVLRILALTDQLIGAPEIARLAGLTPLGARKALERLVRTGFVFVVGGGRQKSYGFRRKEPLIDSLVKLFRAERDRYDELVRRLKVAVNELTPPVQSAWIHRPGNNVLTKVTLGFIGSSTHLALQQSELRENVSEIEMQFDLTIDIAASTRADVPEVDTNGVQLLTGFAIWEAGKGTAAPTSHEALNERTLRRARRIAHLVEKDPTLISRASHHLRRVLREGQGPADRDLQEWRNILAEYSQLRVREFLIDSSERAVRLRQSSPFLPVLDDSQREFVLSDKSEEL